MADALEIDHLSKRYGQTVALADMTFGIGAGELFGFVGSNGAGKTTTMRIAMGVLAADSGDVRWDGEALTLERRRRIGYMPEERGLYPRMHVAEQLTYLGRLRGMSAPAASRAADEWTERLGLEQRRDDDVQKLSLGNQQRCQLAAALVHDPELLILDEPFSGLDPVAVDVMSEVLRERCDAGVPVIFSSHQLELVERICDRVGIVRGGRMVACGSVAELRSGNPVSLVIDAPSAPAGWADHVSGVTVLAQEGSRIQVGLSGDADDQMVLQAALATGPVHEFAQQLPSLTELFRDAMQEHPDQGKEAAVSEPSDIHFGSRRAATLVAKREVTTRLRSRAYLISSALLLIAILVVIVISNVVSGSNSSQDVGFVRGQQSIAAAFRTSAQAVGQDVKTPTVADRAAGEKQLRDGDLDALVVGTTSNGSVQIQVKKQLNDSLRNAFTVLTQQSALNNQLQKAGVDPGAVNAAVAAAKVDVNALERTDPNRGQKLAIGIIGAVAIYIALLVYGQAVAQGVVEEKSSRIVELLLTAIRPWELMLGKVLGIGALGLGQLLLVGVVGVAAGAATGVLTLPGAVVTGAILTVLVWFLLGYITYALLFAGLGALVSRQEDVGSAVAPLTMLIVIPFVLGISILPGNPDSALIAALSLIPLLSPTLMPMRLAGGVAGWQMAVAITLSVLLIIALVWLAGRIYGNAVTRTGARVKLSDALRPI